MRYESFPYIFKICLAAFFLAGTGVTQSDAGPVPAIDAGRQFDYAEQCFSEKEFSTAILEYRRFIYFFPGDGRAEKAMHTIGMAYFLSGNYRDALIVFKQNSEKIKDTGLITESWLMISQCHVMMKEFAPAIITLNNLAALTERTDIRDEAYHRAGWICLEDPDDPESFEKSNAYFSKISPENRDKYNVDEIRGELAKEDMIPKKNPNLAAMLSVVPGAGYVYCGRYRDAAVAFLVNGALILAACESFEEDLEALGVIITCVEAGFYTGNMYGARTSAFKYNRKQKQDYIDTMKKKSGITVSACPRKEGVMISLSYVF